MELALRKLARAQKSANILGDLSFFLVLSHSLLRLICEQYTKAFSKQHIKCLTIYLTKFYYNGSNSQTPPRIALIGRKPGKKTARHCNTFSEINKIVTKPIKN